MLIPDQVYGTFTVTETVFIELIDSKPLQRLKGIAQYGLPARFYHHQGFSRYDHCVGVMLLLRKLGASLEEQIAGLLHDVSHTAFSHVVDWVLGSQAEEDFQDKVHEKIIMQSEIPALLQKYNVETSAVTNYHNYQLLERPSPGLCADRIDYALREFRDWAAPDIVPEGVSALTSHQGKIVFTSRNTADKFARAFLKCQTEHWGAAETVVRYALLSEALKRAIENEIIMFDDMYQDDAYVLQKLEQSSEPLIQDNLRLLAGTIQLVLHPAQPQYQIHKKFRYVDPEFLEEGRVQKLSTVDHAYQQLIEKQRKINEQGIRVSLQR